MDRACSLFLYSDIKKSLNWDQIIILIVVYLRAGVIGARRPHGARRIGAGAVGAAARARAQLQRDPTRRAAVQGAERQHAGARLPHRRSRRQRFLQIRTYRE